MRPNTTTTTVVALSIVLAATAVAASIIPGVTNVASGNQSVAAEPSEPPSTADGAAVGDTLPAGPSFSLEPYLGQALIDAASYAAALEQAQQAELARQVELERQAEAARQAEAGRQAREAAQRQAAAVVQPSPAVTAGSVWDDLAWCESRGNWAMNSGNGFYGGIQFMHSTWLNMGGAQWAYYPHEATREQQIEVATRLQAQYGWGQWPACSSMLGLR